jgi:hypothetical protein
MTELPATPNRSPNCRRVHPALYNSTSSATVAAGRRWLNFEGKGIVDGVGFPEVGQAPTNRCSTRFILYFLSPTNPAQVHIVVVTGLGPEMRMMASSSFAPS